VIAVSDGKTIWVGIPSTKEFALTKWDDIKGCPQIFDGWEAFFGFDLGLNFSAEQFIDWHYANKPNPDKEWVLVARLPNEQLKYMQRHIDPATGMPIRNFSLGRQSTYELKYLGIETNKKFSDDLFVWSPPEGWTQSEAPLGWLEPFQK